MSWVDLRDQLDLYEFYVLLAEALDAEELEDYNFATLVAIAVNNPKKLRSWKWQSKDKAGTKSLASTDPLQAMLAFARQHGANTNTPTGSKITFARATGRPIAYMDTEGRLFDENGQPTVQTSATVIIKMVDLPQQ